MELLHRDRNTLKCRWAKLNCNEKTQLTESTPSTIKDTNLWSIDVGFFVAPKRKEWC